MQEGNAQVIKIIKYILNIYIAFYYNLNSEEPLINGKNVAEIG
jgi:hypothetical protein